MCQILSVVYENCSQENEAGIIVKLGAGIAQSV
jgi:hypothetical protein